jgi:hypothetical protein
MSKATSHSRKDLHGALKQLEASLAEENFVRFYWSQAAKVWASTQHIHVITSSCARHRNGTKATALIRRVPHSALVYVVQGRFDAVQSLKNKFADSLFP